MRLSALARSIQGPAVVILGGASALLVAAYVTTGGSLIPFAVPATFVAVIAAARFPTAAVALVLVLSGFQGTLAASTRIPVTGATDLILGALWIGVAGAYLSGAVGRRTWLWPGLLAPIVYVAITALAILTSDSSSDAFDSFRLSAWYMAALLLIAIAPWSRDTFAKIARGVTLLALAVGCYSIFRYVTGPSVAEAILARSTAFATGLPGSTELRFFGSFPAAQALASWTAALIPFCLAQGLASRGRWSFIALAAAGTCAFALIASDIRTGFVAGIAGIAVVALLFTVAQAFPSGVRLAASTATVIAVVLVGGGVFAVTVGDTDEGVARYERLVQDPSSDASYSYRLSVWKVALDAAQKEPFGYGLGSQGAVGNRREAGPVVSPVLDSSYLKIALEQGLLVMMLFVATMLLLLFMLAVHAVRTSDRFGAALAIGACGTAATAMVLFYGGNYIEGLQVLPVWVLIGLGASTATTRPSGRRLAAAS